MKYLYKTFMNLAELLPKKVIRSNMREIFKITTPKFDSKDILSDLKSKNADIIDLSELNLFEATKAIMMISTYSKCKKNTKNFRYKVSTPNLKNILSEIPLGCSVEFV